MIYLDNAATTMKKPEAVAEAVVAAMGSMGNSGRGAGSAALQASRIIYDARVHLTRLFGGTDPSRLIFTGNSTESLNLAIHGLFVPGDHVITTELEHNSVLRPLYAQQEEGVALTVAVSGRNGTVDFSEIEKAIRPETKAIVCTHASNLTGNVTDLERMGKLAKAYGLLLVVDASQTAGVLDIDVEKMQIDVLCFTGHKSLMGPQGTGGLYVRQGISVQPWKSGGTGVYSFLKKQPEEYPEHLEAGTLNGHGIAGLLAAVQEIERIGQRQIYEKEHRLMTLFYEAVRQIQGVKIYGDFLEENVRCPIAALNIGNEDSSQISDWLQEEYGIITRAGAHCAPLMHAYFHTEKQGMVRFSFSYYNTEEEVSAAVEAVRRIAEEVQV